MQTSQANLWKKTKNGHVDVPECGKVGRSNTTPIKKCSGNFSKGPSINDVGPFFGFYGPPLSPLVGFLLSKIGNFWPPSLPLWGDVVYGWPLIRKQYFNIRIGLYALTQQKEKDFSAWLFFSTWVAQLVCKRQVTNWCQIFAVIMK